MNDRDHGSSSLARRRRSIATRNHARRPYRALAASVGISRDEAHNAVKRLTTSRLVRGGERVASAAALLEFLVGGVPYAFPAEPGAESRGVPTAQSAVPFAGYVDGGRELVWPSSDGQMCGAAVEPLYRGAARTATHNPGLYELLTIVDALRIGGPRERKHAKELLGSCLGTE
jgi:DNA-binding Lrp family transcriptional regulator